MPLNPDDEHTLYAIAQAAAESQGPSVPPSGLDSSLPLIEGQSDSETETSSGQQRFIRRLDATVKLQDSNS